jgi:ATP-dependent RNA/DNA helicase IGHMBP2
MRVLVTAPSNVAVDNILERLAQNISEAASPSSTSSTALGRKNKTSSALSSSTNHKSLKMVRLGHPARIKSSVVAKFSLEALVHSADGTEIVHDVRNELQSFLNMLANPRTKSQDKRIVYRELKTLRKEIRTREERVVQDLISSANVVLATTVGASNRVLDNRRGGDEALDSDFDLVIIDEAAQALEASCWIPILRGKKVVLAGDHLQLPPTIKSKDRRAIEGLGQTMFERLQKLYKPINGKSDVHPISRMLKIQYRMHHLIADWASQVMYHGELLTHDSVRNRTLAELPSVIQQHKLIEGAKANAGSLDNTENTTLMLVDTAGCDMHEEATAAGSRFNEGEAFIVNQHTRKLIELGLKQEEIAVITPYNGQCELLRSLLLPDFPKLEIRSVDGFQGGEKEAVILSLVRSSDRALNGIGFLRDDRRQNVAVTRARRHLAVICDSETVSKSSFIGTLINWIEKHGDHRSAIEYTSHSTRKDKEYESDLQAAEELLKMVETSVPSSISSKAKAKATPGPLQKKATVTKYDKELEESKRKALMDKISLFAKTANDGDELSLSSELTSYDRRLVHEFAEQTRLLHRSEGVDGVDRRIILTVRRSSANATNDEIVPPTLDEILVDDHKQIEVVVDSAPVSNFAALALDESDDDSDESTNKDNSETETAQPTPTSMGQDTTQSGNALLSQLAKERAARQQSSPHTMPGDRNAASGNKKKKKQKGQRLGGKTPKVDTPKDDGLDDLDDMAFLDAQIDKNANAHGRKVIGGGKQYRTVINGILNSRPEPQPKQTNTKASKSLQGKLREAESARKAKPKKK